MKLRLFLFLVAFATGTFAHLSGDSQPTASVSGSVVDTVTGQPVPGAQIFARNVGNNGGVRRYNAAASSTTGPDGRFSMDGLPAGRYVLRASRNGYVNPNRGHRFSGNVLTLAPGGHEDDVVISITPGGIISGHISDENGGNLAHASVDVAQYSYERNHWESFNNTLSNSTGEYKIEGLVGGKYHICASVHSDQKQEEREKARVRSCYLNAVDQARAVAVDVRPGQQVGGIDITISPVHTVRVSGHVIDARTSQPIRRANVQILGDDGNTSFNSVDLAPKDHGSFHFSGIPAGTYVIVAGLDADDPSQSLWGQTTVEVGEQNVGGVELVMAPGVDVSGQVTVDGKTSVNLSGLQAELDRQESANLAGDMPGVDPAPVKQDGTFVFHNVPEGNYKIGLSPLGMSLYLKSGGSSDVLESGFTVTRGQPGPFLNLVLATASVWVEGTVSNDDQPATGVSVVLVPDPAGRSQRRLYRTAMTDSYGKFSLHNVAPGDYEIFAWEGMQGAPYMDPDFLREYQDEGQELHVQDAAHVNVQLEVNPAP